MSDASSFGSRRSPCSAENKISEAPVDLGEQASPVQDPVAARTRRASHQNVGSRGSFAEAGRDQPIYPLEMEVQEAEARPAPSGPTGTARASRNSISNRVSQLLHRTSMTRRESMTSGSSRRSSVHPGNSIGKSLGGTNTDEEKLVAIMREGIWQLFRKEEEGAEAPESKDGVRKMQFSFLGQEALLEQFQGDHFRKVRKVFGIVESEYVQVLSEGGGGRQTGFRHIGVGGANSKSLSWFLVVGDLRYMLKTCTEVEAYLMLEILPSYLKYTEQNPSTLLPRFYGLYRVSVGGGKGTFYFVMNNVFAARHPLVYKYDLKGSTFGRYSSDQEKEKGAKATLKDLDLLRRGPPLVLRNGAEAYNKVTQMIQKDSEFLASHNLLDYSMMVGLAKQDFEDELPLATSRHVVHLEPLEASEDEPNVLYLGIIDILTKYNCMKFIEANGNLLLCKGDVSCKPPPEYAARFCRFLRHVLCEPEDPRRFLKKDAMESLWLDRDSDLQNRDPPSKGAKGSAGATGSAI